MTTYNIAAFDIEVTDVTQPLLHGEDLTALTANSESSMNVTQAEVNSWLKFKTDAIDINDTNGTDDLVFETNSDAWGVSAFAGVSTVDSNEALNVGNQTVEYDRVRWMARDMFAAGAQPGAYGVDLLSNESDLRSDVSARDSNIEDAIKTAIASANNLLMNNDSDDNIGRAIVLKCLQSNTGRFNSDDLLANSARDASGFYPFTFEVGDIIVMKVTYKQDATKQPTAAGLSAITDHSYLYKMNVIA